MIVICPQCGARYRLDDTVVARGARMRCAACQHRWRPGDEASAAFDAAAPVRVMGLPHAEVPPPAADAPGSAALKAEPVIGSDDDPGSDARVDSSNDSSNEAGEPDTAARRPWLRTLVAIALGGALTAGAAGLWLGDVDPETLPGIGPVLAQWQAPPRTLAVQVSGQVRHLDTGPALLEITGRITNTGTAPQPLSPIILRLHSPGGFDRRWQIAAPVAVLAPGAAVDFATTTTGFPTEARLLSAAVRR